MALTDAQKLDVRRYAGYPLIGDATITDVSDLAYGFVSPVILQTLFHRLNTLQPAEETVLTSVYLANLTTLEAAIPAAGDNLDTDQAAVWYHNKSEVADRTTLFDKWRRDMCGFLGIPAGPALGSGVGGAIQLTRC